LATFKVSGHVSCVGRAVPGGSKMRNSDDLPFIVIEKDSGGSLGSFVLGALVGAGVALLFAPQTGQETQEEIRARAKKLREAAEERLVEAQKGLEDRMGDVREGVQARVEKVREAVSSGRDAARDARSDLETKLERSKAAYRAGVSAAREAVAAGSDGEAEEES
jgi:gas vesicle protein